MDSFGNFAEEGEDLDDLEEEDELEETEDDKEHKNKLKEVVETLRSKRAMSAQRPSTIVHVNTGALEIHLRQMKKQLQRHEEELKHPVWMDDLMKEVNKIAILERKLEHCQLDINNLRELMSSKNLKPISDSEISEKMKQLFSDLEGVRLIIRRIDLQNALQSNALAKISELQKAVKGILKDQKGGANASHLLRLQDTLEGQINLLRSKTDELDSNATTLRCRVVEGESHLLSKLDALDKSHTTRLSNLEEKAMQDIELAVKNMKDKLEHTTITAKRAILLSLKNPLTKGSEMMQTAVAHRRLEMQRLYFRRWQEFDPCGVLRRGRNALRLFTRSGQRFLLRKAYFDWKKYHKLKILRERYAQRIKNILRIWERSVNPNISLAFRKWKRSVVFMKFHGSFQQYSRANSLAPYSRATSIASPLPSSPSPQTPQQRKRLEPAYSFDFDSPSAAPGEGASTLPVELLRTLSSFAPPPRPELQEDGLYGTLMGTLNIRKDPDGCVDLIGLYIDNILEKMRGMAELMGSTHILINNNSDTLERNRLHLLQTMNSRFETIESVHNYHKTGVSGQFARLRQEAKEREELLEEKHADYRQEFSKISGQLSQLDKRLCDQEEKITRLYNLHGMMLDRMDKMEATQSAHQGELTALHEVVSRVDSMANRHESNFKERTQRMDDSMVHLNSEIQANKLTQKQILKRLEEVLQTQVNGTSDVKSIAHDITRRMDKLESWMNTTAPLPPTPLEVATVCVSYEDKAMESHSRGRGGNHLLISTDMAYDMARIAHILAHHVVEITDIDILSHVMKGLHLSFSEGNPHQETHESPWPQPSAPSRATGAPGGGVETETVPLTHEEYCLSLREKFLLSYFDQFQFDIEKLRPEVGIVRKEARLTFLRRFIESLELSLSKLDAIVVGTSSSLGRTNAPASASCIACDRPLRMRVTSTPLGRLHSRVAQSQELSPKSKRKQLSQTHQQHNSTSSFPPASASGHGSGKKKGGLLLGGMTFPISSSAASAAKSPGVSAMDFFHNTITEEVSDSLPGEGQEQREEEDLAEERQEEEHQKEELPVTSPRAASGEGGTQGGAGGGLAESQSTSVLANELRKLVKLSSSTPQLPATTALSGYSKAPTSARGQKQQHQTNRRPKSAGPAGHLPNSTTKIKPTQLTYGGPSLPGAGGGGGGMGMPSGEELVPPRYVKKGGFKMRASKTMPQERLVENLSKNYFQDQSFPQRPPPQIQGQSQGVGAEIFFPSPGDLQHLNSSDGCATGFNLSSVSQPIAEREKR